MRSVSRLRLTVRTVVLTVCALSVINLSSAITGRAADDQQVYHSDTLGVSFQYPADWKLREQTATQTVIVSSAADDTALQNGQAPAGLIFSLTFSTFRQVGAAQVSDFGDRIKQVAGTPDATPQPAHIGGADGLSVNVLDGNAGVAGQTSILSIGQRRIAVVRGVATIQAWVHGTAQTQFQSIADTLSFFPPKNAVNEDQIGRALWQTADPRFSAFADIGATADGSSVLATDPKNGLWTISANGLVGDVKTYDGMASYGALALFQDGTRYIADPVNHAIWLIQANGTPKKLLGGTVGSGRGAFGADSPRVFAFGYQNTINALDVNDKGTRIQVFDRGGDPLTAWDIPAVQDGAMATDPDGYVYVVGSNLSGILKVSAAGKIVAQDLGKAALNGITMRAIDVDRFGNIYVATGDSGIMKLDSSGALQGVIGQPYDESAPPKLGQIGQPTALTLGDGQNILYVADSGKYPQILAFALNNNAAINVDAGTKAIGTLNYGQTVNGEITTTAFVNTYTFTGKAGDVVTITMRAAASSSLDAYVDLLGPDGSRLAANDDAPKSAGLAPTDAQIAAFKLPYGGTYTIRATRFGRETTSATGTYTLELDKQ